MLFRSLYELKFEELLQLDKFKDKKVQNIIDGLENSKLVPFEKVLFALGIRYVGETVAKKLAFHYLTIDNLIAASFDELVSVDEIGGKIAESLVDYFSDLDNLDLIAKLRKTGIKFEVDEDTKIDRTDKLKGLTFVVSGVFKLMSRNDLKKAIEDNGGKSSGSISKKTNYILAGENMGPSKLAKAQELGVDIISEEQFIEMIS